LGFSSGGVAKSEEGFSSGGIAKSEEGLSATVDAAIEFFSKTYLQLQYLMI
jgi:hypothetical protein